MAQQKTLTEDQRDAEADAEATAPVKRSYTTVRYPKKMKDDALTLYVRGYTPRPIRRILAKKYEQVPSIDTVQNWIRKSSKEVKEIAALSTETDVLIALEAEGDFCEDVSDDILNFAIPVVMENGEEKFRSLPYDKQLDIVLKEINNKARRNEQKILRLDPSASPNTQLNVFINNAKAAHAAKATEDVSEGIPDGATTAERSSGNISESFDAEVIEG